MHHEAPIDVKTQTEQLREELAKVIVGQEDVIELLLVSVLCQGHCLMIGVPGLAKTLLVKSFSEVVNLDFNRIQFTPDLMPSDIIGSEFVRENNGTLGFEYKLGPIFANLILADEINRTPPKTQAALLEAMQERRVTAGGATHQLPNPFLVIATQNPIEHEGTYPLPEAQLDRFMFSLDVTYPDRESEVEIVKRTTNQAPPPLQKVWQCEQLLAAQEWVRAVPVTDHIVRYAVDLVAATRPAGPSAAPVAKEYLEWGAGPRASQFLILAAKALALLDGRATPEVADVQRIAIPVIQHRLVLNYRASGAGVKGPQIVRELIEAVPQPHYK
jgi:MoxR-like ATPase